MPETHDIFARHRDDADRMARSDSMAARLRLQLLKIERAGERAGWDSDLAAPMIFSISAYRRTHYVQHQWHQGLNFVLHRIIERTGDADGALTQIAESTENLSRAKNGEYPAEVIDAFRKIRADFNSGQDWRFLGFGIRFEAWLVSAAPEERDALRKEALNKRLHMHPERKETRVVHFSGRDGLTWFISRKRGHHPDVLLQKPESDSGYFGSVVNAISRITNSFADNPVPIAQEPVES